MKKERKHNNFVIIIHHHIMLHFYVVFCLFVLFFKSCTCGKIIYGTYESINDESINDASTHKLKTVDNCGVHSKPRKKFIHR